MNMFNVRVYGILINPNEEVLVLEEFHNNTKMTKFPGGGLEFGEGTIECLRREALEELNLEIEVLSHFYTTDFFQLSAFNPEDQIISIYYLISAPGVDFLAPTFSLALNAKEEGIQTFRWVAKKDLSEGMFTFPIDKKVSRLLQKN
jgi:8-oxo-dGTP diphosphatase